MICRLAAALEADEEEVLVLAKKVPPAKRNRVLERPEVFGKLARLDGMNRVIGLPCRRCRQTSMVR